MQSFNFGSSDCHSSGSGSADLLAIALYSIKVPKYLVYEKQISQQINHPYGMIHGQIYPSHFYQNW
jgi:hypothetical protein